VAVDSAAETLVVVADSTEVAAEVDTNPVMVVATTTIATVNYLSLHFTVN
jgi:hypothetical protein